MAGPLSDGATAKQQELQVQIEQIHEKEEIKYLQRGRAYAFFQSFASMRRKINFIKKL